MAPDRGDSAPGAKSRKKDAESMEARASTMGLLGAVVFGGGAGGRDERTLHIEGTAFQKQFLRVVFVS
jgi:hypothetical protein